MKRLQSDSYWCGGFLTAVLVVVVALCPASAHAYYGWDPGWGYGYDDWYGGDVYPDYYYGSYDYGYPGYGGYYGPDTYDPYGRDYYSDDWYRDEPAFDKWYGY